jgi:hypothetical protein
MKRVKYSDKTPYRVVIKMEKVLDAVEWCKAHKSKGVCDVAWGINTGENSDAGDIIGTFYFDKKEDFILFCLKWC